MKSTILELETRNASVVSEDQNTPAGVGGVAIFMSIDTDAIPDPEEFPEASLLFAIEIKDPVSGKYYAIQSHGGINTDEAVAGLFVLFLGTELPRVWRVSVAAEGEAEWTYSIGASPIYA